MNIHSQYNVSNNMERETTCNCGLLYRRIIIIQIQLNALSGTKWTQSSTHLHKHFLAMITHSLQITCIYFRRFYHICEHGNSHDGTIITNMDV